MFRITVVTLDPAELTEENLPIPNKVAAISPLVRTPGNDQENSQLPSSAGTCFYRH